ncbi:hypothetical protein Droror1_Dr00015183 [Drosera rotundifolia]
MKPCRIPNPPQISGKSTRAPFLPSQCPSLPVLPPPSSHFLSAAASLAAQLSLPLHFLLSSPLPTPFENFKTLNPPFLSGSPFPLSFIPPAPTPSPETLTAPTPHPRPRSPPPPPPQPPRLFPSRDDLWSEPATFTLILVLWYRTTSQDLRICSNPHEPRTGKPLNALNHRSHHEIVTLKVVAITRNNHQITDHAGRRFRVLKFSNGVGRGGERRKWRGRESWVAREAMAAAAERKREEGGGSKRREGH